MTTETIPRRASYISAYICYNHKLRSIFTWCWKGHSCALVRTFLVMRWLMFHHRELNSFSGAKLCHMLRDAVNFSSDINRCGSKLTTLCNTLICNFMRIQVMDNKVDSICWRCWILKGTVALFLFLWCVLPQLLFSGLMKLALFPLIYFTGKKVACFCIYRQQ